jgi:oxygen-dependent protoporphyrinogen oxidase
MMPTRVVVAGGGIAGLTAAFTSRAEAERRGIAVDVTVIEAAAEAGGHARTIVDGDWVIDTGPNGFLDREPETLALVKDLGLEAHLVAASAARRRFIVRRGRLRQVPESPRALLASDSISWAGKLRLLCEPWAPAPPPDKDETVFEFEFAERRLGREAADTFVDTAVSGITAGDSKALSVRSQLPILPEWEKAHGSLFRALVAARKGSKGRPRLHSFDRGIGTLTRRLAGRLGNRLLTGSPIVDVDRSTGAWRLHLENGSKVVADHVVFATPAHRTSQILRTLDRELSDALASIPYSGLAVVALGYETASLSRPLDGTGYLVTRAERLATLGVLWESSVFPGRAPDAAVLLRVFLGGSRRPDVIALNDEALTSVAQSELAKVMGITATPILQRVFRWPSAIAQYTVGHEQRVRDIRARLALHAGFHLCGTATDGVSLNHAIASAKRTARELVSRISDSGTIAAGLGQRL